MLRGLFVIGSLSLFLVVGCVSRQTYTTRVAELESSLSEKDAEVVAYKTRLADARRTQETLKAEVTRYKTRAEQLAAELKTLARQVADIKKKYGRIDVALVEELQNVPGLACDKTGAVQLTVPFQLGGVTLDPDAEKALRTVAKVLAKRKGLVVVCGHSDNTPVAHPDTQKAYVDNLGISLARAAAVARVLIQGKVAPDRLVVQGFGSTRPIAPNKTKEGRARNRRVEVRFVPASR